MESLVNQPSPDQNISLQVRRLFSAPRERVFHAWIEREALQKWLSAGGTEVIVTHLDAQVGGGYRFETTAPDGTRTAITGKYLEVRFPERLVFTWSSTITDDKETLVTIEFIAHGTSTEIILTHDRFANETIMASHKQGWTELLERLASAVKSD